MSKDKKSFLLFKDALSVLDDLTDEQAGLLFKAIRDYQENGSVKLDGLIKIAFAPFKNQFIRDNDKYKKLCEKNKLIADLRYSNNNTKSTTGNQPLPTVTKSTDKDKDKDKDKDNKTIKEDGFDYWWNSYPRKAAKPAALKSFKSKTKSMSESVFMEFVDLISNDSSVRFEKTEKQFIPNPATYLNQERYNDEQ